jgi:hypothetical protein
MSHCAGAALLPRQAGPGAVKGLEFMGWMAAYRRQRAKLVAVESHQAGAIPHARAKIERLLAMLELVLAHITELERERNAVAETAAPDHAARMIHQLAGLRGIGVQSATVLVRDRRAERNRACARSFCATIRQRKARKHAVHTIDFSIASRGPWLFIVDRQHHRVGWRLEVEPDDVATLAAKTGSFDSLKERMRCG